MTETKVILLPRAYEDLQNIGAFWKRNIRNGKAREVIKSIISDLKTLKLFYPAATEIRNSTLKNYRYYKSGQYVCICKKVENIIYVYHIAHADTEYPNLFYGFK